MDLRFMNAVEAFELVKSGAMNEDQFYEWLSFTVQDAFCEGVKSKGEE